MRMKFSGNKYYLCLLLFMFTMTGFTAEAVDLKNHSPRFTWKVLGGVVNPEQWIYDGDIPVAMFEQRYIEQPGENLLFFDGTTRPPLLRHLKLTPNGMPLIEGVQLYWVLIARHVITDKLLDIDIEGQGTDRLTVTFVTEDAHATALSRRVLTLTYDTEKQSYAYDFQCFLDLKSPESYNDRTTGLEFTDPWLVGCPGPAVKFNGMWERRYQRFIYESGKGGVNAIPINHFTTSHKGGITLKRDGLFTAVHEPDGNPAFQFVGDTADKSSIGICWWGYDLHFNRTVTPDETDNTILAHFRIFQCPESKVKSLENQAVMQALKPDEWGGKKEYPVYERNSGFDNGIALNGVYEGDVDPFPWKIVGDGAVWDKTSGRTDSSCLKISRTEAGVTTWETFQGDGEGYFAEPWTPCKGYRVSCYVKTDSVTGGSSTLAVQYHIPNRTQIHPIYTARKLSGTNGWTKLELEVGSPPPETGCLMIKFLQDGPGTTWFDDLEVELLQ